MTVKTTAKIASFVLVRRLMAIRLRAVTAVYVICRERGGSGLESCQRRVI